MLRLAGLQENFDWDCTGKGYNFVLAFSLLQPQGAHCPYLLSKHEPHSPQSHTPCCSFLQEQWGVDEGVRNWEVRGEPQVLARFPQSSSPILPKNDWSTDLDSQRGQVQEEEGDTRRESSQR